MHELLTAGRRKVHELMLSSGSDDAPELKALESLAREAGVRIKQVPADQIERRARTGAPQGVIAFAAPVPAADLDELLADPARSSSRSTGSPTRRTWARSCAPPRRPVPPASCSPPTAPPGSPRQWRRRPRERSSTCRSRSSPASPVRSIAAKRAGVWCAGLDADGDQSVFDLSVADAPLVLVLGAEGRGLSRLARRAAT